MELKVKLTEENRKKIVVMEFEVPERCRKIKFVKKIDYSVQDAFRNKIDVSFFDENGKAYGRFDRYGNYFEISSASHTSKSISPGKWNACFEVFQIYEDIDLELEVEFECAETYKTFKGEFHTHTDITDGKLPPLKMAEYLKEKRYDFFFMTDHNSVDAWDCLKDVEGIGFFRGLELTTFYGHILLLGVQDYVRWYKKNGELRELDKIRKDVKNKKGLMGLAHPFACGGPFCAGCRWETDINPEFFDFIEVWNSKLENYKNNWEAVDLWIEMLKKDIRIFCSCGADFHKTEDMENVLKANVLSVENTEDNITDAIRNGRFYISKNTEVKFSLNGRTFGQTAGKSDSIKIDMEIRGLSEGTNLYYFTKNGMKPFNYGGELGINEASLYEKDFVVLMGVNSDRQLEFLTNPVFVE